MLQRKVSSHNDNNDTPIVIMQSLVITHHYLDGMAHSVEQRDAKKIKLHHTLIKHKWKKLNGQVGFWRKRFIENSRVKSVKSRACA